MKIVAMVLGVAVVVCVAGCSATGPAAGSGKKAAPLNMKVTVSATQRNYKDEGPPEALVDGDHKTRWASPYKDNQNVVLDMGKKIKLSGVRLLWEKAAAKTYSVSLSNDGKNWKKADTITNAKIGPRTDLVKLKGKEARFLRLDLTKRATDWGFSLYEIEPVPALP